MKIYEKNNNVLSVYDLEIDRSALLEYRQEHLENVKSAILRFDSDNKKEFDLTYNKETIYNYIFGLYDDMNSSYITIDDENNNSIYLFDNFTTEGVLLSGALAEIQPVVRGDITFLDFLEKNNYDEELLSLIKIKRLKDIILDDLNLLLDDGIVQYDTSFESRLRQSQILLSHYKKYVAKELEKVKKLGVNFDSDKKYF